MDIEICRVNNVEWSAAEAAKWRQPPRNGSRVIRQIGVRITTLPSSMLYWATPTKPSARCGKPFGFPDNPGAYANLIGVLCAANRLNEAQAVYEETRSRNLGSPYLLQYKYSLDFLRGDAAGMQEQLLLATGVPRTEDVLLSAQADTEAYYGQLEQARNFSRRAADSAERADATEAAATWKAWQALREAETGNSLEARRDAEQALALIRGRDIRVFAALALARAGDIVQAQQLAESAEQEFPQDTLLQNYSLPSIRAAIQLQQNKPLIAIETLEVSRPYELGQGSLTYMYPSYLRGEAYLKTRQGEKAAAEFENILAHRGLF